MKLIHIILFLTFCKGSFAQKCSYDVDEVDKFSREHKQEKQIKMSSSGMYDGRLDIILCKYDSSIFYRINYYKNAVVGATDKMIFLLENDESFSAHPMKMYVPNIGSQTVLHAAYTYDNISDFEKLKQYKVKSIRIFYNDVYHDIDVKGKLSENLFAATKCF